MLNLMDEKLINDLVCDAEKVWPQNFSDIEETFNKCCFSISFHTIKQLNLFKEKKESETLSSIKKKVNLFKDAEYIMKHILKVLCDEQVLEKHDDNYVCVDTDPYIETPAEILVSATRAFPDEGAPFQWLARAYDGLVSFITGNLYAEEVMLPFGSFKLLEQVYNTSNVYGFYSRLAARAVKRIVETKFNSPVTLLEVGAGTGNGTENVLNQTNDRFKKYIFTDVSKSLVQMGRRRFKKKKYDFLEYQELDISGDSSFRTMQEQQIDIILGVNVFHATDDIICSLNNANRILKKGGILILSEIAPPCDSIYRYMEFTFGLLPSYSMYRDKDIRPLAPIIRPEQWANALEKTGFSDILTIPGTRSDKMDRGGIVIGIK